MEAGGRYKAFEQFERGGKGNKRRRERGRRRKGDRDRETERQREHRGFILFYFLKTKDVIQEAYANVNQGQQRNGQN